MNTGIYIHVPFCKSKCPYCDFYSEVGKKPEYLPALIKEIEMFRSKSGDMETVDTVYFGGGTPSILEPDETGLILDSLKNKFHFQDPEITIEVNPKTVDFEKLSCYREQGINRLSIGAQSFDDSVLKKLGRVHKSTDNEDVFYLARQAGFSNISIDLMFGIEGQTQEVWIDTVKRAIGLMPEHISLYSLEFMPGTKFSKWLEEGRMKETDTETDRKMYHKALELTREAGYIQYEISNVSMPYHQSRHNMKYWNLDEYIGFGPSASSYYGGKRTTNFAGLDKYAAYIGKGLSPAGEIVFNEPDDDMSEYTFTKLRTNEGLEYYEFQNRFGVRFWEHFGIDTEKEFIKYSQTGHTVLTDDGIRLTETGFDISNKILCLFV